MKAERFVDTSRLLTTRWTHKEIPHDHSHTATQSRSHTERREMRGGLSNLRSRLAGGCAVASSPRCNYSSSGDVQAAQQQNDKKRKRRRNVLSGGVALNDIDERGKRFTAPLFGSPLFRSLTFYPRPRTYL